MDITGKIIEVLPEKSGVSASTGNPWKVQSYVIETHDQYPRRMCFDVFGDDKIKAFNIQAGQELTVSFDIDARQYQGRWFNSIRAWKVAPAQQEAAPVGAVPPFDPTQSAPISQAPASPQSAPASTQTTTGDNADDLPF